jgi:hypothetical protein
MGNWRNNYFYHDKLEMIVNFTYWIAFIFILFGVIRFLTPYSLILFNHFNLV